MRPSPRHGDRGFTMATTMIVMSLTLSFVALAVGMAIAGLTHSQSARSVERAQAAADAGADIAGYRMNKTLLAPAAAGLVGLVPATLQTVGCAGVNLGFGSTSAIGATASNVASTAQGSVLSLVGIPSGSNFCRTGSSETLDDGSSFRYAISTKIDLTPVSGLIAGQGFTLNQLVVRQIAVIGQSGGQTRRVIVSYWLNLAGATSTRLFQKRRYVRCPSLPITASDPFANCPANPGY